MISPNTSPSQFEPRGDPIYQFLMEGSAAGQVPVYAIEASWARFRRHDPFWAPEHSPDGINAMKQIMARLGNGEDMRPWVYPCKDRLIYSDDYFLMACFEMLKVETIRAWHLLVPDTDVAAHGPLKLEFVRQKIISSVRHVYL